MVTVSQTSPMPVPDTESPLHGLPRALPIPVTFAGIVTFSRRSAAWLLIAWLGMAVFASVVTVAFLHLRWIPVAEDGIRSLPDHLTLEQGVIKGLSDTDLFQQQTGFLSLIVTGSNTPPGNMTADFQIVFMPHELRLSSVLGSYTIPYSTELTIDLIPSNLIPWWQARKALFTALAASLMSLLLLTTWIVLGSCYFIPIAITNYFTDRRNEFWPTWRLAGSVLIPGALVMSLAILLYGLHLLGILGLLLATVLHVLVAWVYAAGAVRRIPRISSVIPRGANPFSAPDSTAANSPDPTFRG